MFLLFGEERITKIIHRNEFACPVCRGSRLAQRLAETSYFTLFRIPLLPLNRRSDYWECSGCGHAFVDERAEEPSANQVIRHVLVYIMLGYSATAHLETLRQIFARIAGSTISEEEVQVAAQLIERTGPEILDFLKRSAYRLNIKGKEQVIEAAFLMTHASCEIQQQDRLRVNLLGAALGLSLEQMESVLERVRAQRYYGVRRNLITS